jgi:hypothetical protein
MRIVRWLSIAASSAVLASGCTDSPDSTHSRSDALGRASFPTVLAPPTVTCDPSGGGITVSQDYQDGLGLWTYQSLVGDSTTIIISLGGSPVEEMILDGLDSTGATGGIVLFGSPIQGISTIAFTSDGQTVSEQVDGRIVQPLSTGDVQNASTGSLPAVTFADGGPPPTVTAPAGFFSDIGLIAAAAQTSTSECGLAPVVDGPAGSSGSPPFEPGHSSNVLGSSRCLGCNNNCALISVACLGAAGVACGSLGATLSAVPFLAVAVGITCGVLADIGCVGAKNACTDGCKNVGNPCCPINCGNSCCDFNETCLNAGSSLCCAPPYTICQGPAESCVNTSEAVCLASGAGCPIGMPTCGSGQDVVCCPTGICDGTTCDPALAITVNLSETSEGPRICTNGVGFTPGATVAVTYSGVPGQSGSFVAGYGQADPQGNFSFTDFSQVAGLVVCSDLVAFDSVTITAQDGTIPSGTGATTSAAVAAAFWCGNFATSGGSGTQSCP